MLPHDVKSPVSASMQCNVTNGVFSGKFWQHGWGYQRRGRGQDGRGHKWGGRRRRSRSRRGGRNTAQLLVGSRLAGDAVAREATADVRDTGGARGSKGGVFKVTGKNMSSSTVAATTWYEAQQINALGVRCCSLCSPCGTLLPLPNDHQGSYRGAYSAGLIIPKLFHLPCDGTNQNVFFLFDLKRPSRRNTHTYAGRLMNGMLQAGRRVSKARGRAEKKGSRAAGVPHQVQQVSPGSLSPHHE